MIKFEQFENRYSIINVSKTFMILVDNVLDHHNNKYYDIAVQQHI